MNAPIPPLHEPVIPTRFKSAERGLWFLRGVRDGTGDPKDSHLTFAPRPSVLHHQSYTAFRAYCQGFHVGRRSQWDPRR